MIPIVMATDDLYIEPTLVTLYSVCKNSKGSTISVTILCGRGLSNEGKKKFLLACKHFDNIEIKFYQVNEQDFLCATTHEHITIPTFYRLIIEDVLQEDKCIYLDSDLIVLSDISDLYSIEIGESAIAGVRDKGFLYNPEYAISHGEKWGITDMHNYINAGVLLMNLKKFRSIHAKEIMLKEMQNPFPLGDQDILNKVFKSDKVELMAGFNCFHMYNLKDLDIRSDEVKIIHYAGKYKPWIYPYCNFADLWWSFAKECLEIENIDKLTNEARNVIAMMDWDNIVQHCKDNSDIIIVGYSKIGMDVFSSLKRCNVKAKLHFADNSPKKQKLGGNNLEIISVMECVKKYPSALFLITSQNYADELTQEILGLGISKSSVMYYVYRGEGYYNVLGRKALLHELREYFQKKIGEKP